MIIPGIPHLMKWSWASGLLATTSLLTLAARAAPTAGTTCRLSI